MATSDTVKNTIVQVNSLRGLHPSTVLIALDDETLRIHSKRGQNVRNVDIRYNQGTDLYTVSVHTFSAPKYNVLTEVTENVFAEDIANFFPDRVVLSR